MITITDYFMGRREQYPFAMSPQIESSAVITVDLANQLLERAVAAGVDIEPHVNSGWRPPAVNANTPGASTTSKHMTGEAIDLGDPDGLLDAWLMTDEGQAVLVELGLWHEDPGSTKGWAHVQTKPPRSGNRTFKP